MILNKKGSSILEMLAAVVIVVIAFTATMSFVLSVKKNTQTLLSSRSRSIQLQKIAQLILADPKLFKVNFNPSEAAACEDLATSNLPLAWDDNKIDDIANCEGCLGRLGFVIQPFPVQSIRGVYLVTIRVAHPKLTTNASASCNGEIIEGVEQLQMIVSLR